MPRSSEGFQWTQGRTSQGLETQAVVASTSPTVLKESYDVIVIGAGYAGLVAARDLSTIGGANVLLLEARDRIGGRTWTASVFEENVEIGGTWLHWNQPIVFSELYRYGLHKYIKPSNGLFAPEKTYYKPATDAVHQVSTPEMDASLEKLAIDFFSIDGYTSRQLMPYPFEPFREALWTKYDTLSVRSRLNQIEGSKQDKDLFETLMGTIGSCPGNDLGFVEPLRWFALGGHTVAGMFEVIETFKLGGGGQTSFARGIFGDYRGHIKLNTVVEKIEQGQNGVTISIRNGQPLKAKYAISTIPLNVLPDIQFLPPFTPQRKEAIDAGHMNKGVKIHYKTKRPVPAFLSMANGYGTSPLCLAFSDHNGTRGNEGKGTYIIGFGYNRYLYDRENYGDIVAALKNMNPEVEVEGYATHDWVNDPYSKGAWSAWGPGYMTKYLRELQKPHGRVHFASADWADGWRGFIDGAIERGAASARDVHQLLKQNYPTKL